MAAATQDNMVSWVRTLNHSIKHLDSSDSQQKLKIAVYLPDGSHIEASLTESTTAKDIFMNVCHSVLHVYQVQLIITLTLTLVIHCCMVILQVLQTLGVTRGLQYFALVEETPVAAGANATRVLSEKESVHSMLLKNVNKQANNRLVLKRVIFVEDDACIKSDQMVLTFQYSKAVSNVLET